MGGLHLLFSREGGSISALKIMFTKSIQWFQMCVELLLALGFTMVHECWVNCKVIPDFIYPFPQREAGLAHSSHLFS